MSDVAAYIAHRITVAGGQPTIFTPEAMRLIAAASDGIPRLVNTLCDLSLVYGFSEGHERIGVPIVRSVLRDRVRMGLPLGVGGARDDMADEREQSRIGQGVSKAAG